MSMKNFKTVDAVIPSLFTLEGEGFEINRAFPTPQWNYFDPFLLLDEMGPAVHTPHSAKGAPDHPHRGFETVTYLLDGEFEHKDSAGNYGKIRKGGVQWMTAGSGVVHSELPSQDFQKTGGRLHGFQLWVNLPASHKMVPPRYQEKDPEDIPSYSENGFKVKIIAGSLYGVEAKIETIVPFVYWHFTIEANVKIEIPTPNINDKYNIFSYLISGSGKFEKDGKLYHKGNSVVFKKTNDDFIQIESGIDGLEFLILGGIPIGEPVARYGPFVMNTKEEIYQAFEDYQSGKMGRILH
jgi:quercetin 2,3-dioxygenase